MTTQTPAAAVIEKWLRI